MFSVVEDEASKQINKEKKIIDKEEALQSILRKIFCCCAIMLDSTECIDIVVQFLVTNYEFGVEVHDFFTFIFKNCIFKNCVTKAGNPLSLLV